ncbi:MAG: protein kinase [Novipirellula sp. JB048]
MSIRESTSLDIGVFLVAIGFVLAEWAGIAPSTTLALGVLVIAVASRRAARWFELVLGLVILGFVLPLIWPGGGDPSVVRVTLALACIATLTLLRYWETESSPPGSSGAIGEPQLPPRTTSPGSDPGPSAAGDHAGSLVPAAQRDPSDADADSSQTKVIRKSLLERTVIERLRCSERFSHQQLKWIEDEIATAMASQSSTDWSFRNLVEGSLIGGYRIEGILSEGGGGQVYRATPIAGGDMVAIKVLRDIQMSERFRREMELVGKLAHPNIVVSYEVGEHSGMLYIVMERLAGPDLSVDVRLNGPLTWQDSLEVILQAARALEHAHQRGLIHRDVKPGNLLRDGKRRIKVTDLGLATLVNERHVASVEDFQTGGQMVAGTTDFMAPEQARSLASATALSDIYGLGATWFYLLTGRSRVRGASLNEKLTSLLIDKTLEPLPENIAPAAVLAIWDRMVAYQPEDRFQSMSEVIAALESVRPAEAGESAKHAVEVLVVEDNQDDLFLTVEMLRRMNKSIVVHKAFTLAQAIGQHERNGSLDIVLLDLQLADSSGVETIKRFRAAAPSVPIVVLSGQQDDQIGNTCIEAGADEFACKHDLNPALLERLIFVTLSRYDRHDLA